MKRSHFRFGILAALVFVGSLIVAPLTRAETDQGQILVTATLVGSLRLTLPDQTANFGSNLNQFGQPSNSNDLVNPTDLSGSHLYYRWRPTFAAISTVIVIIDSSSPAVVRFEATESTGTSTDLRVGQGDLKLSNRCSDAADTSPSTQFIDDFTGAFMVTWPYWEESVPAGNSGLCGSLYLKVNTGDDPGTFNSILTISATS